MKRRKLKHSHHGGTHKSSLPCDFTHFCREIIKINSKNPTAYFNLAYEQNLTGDLQSSVLNYERGLKLNPFNVTALNNLAIIYIFVCDYTKGIDLLSQALGIDTDSLIALLYRGRAYRLSGRLGESITDYDHAIECYPDSAEAYMGRKETKILQQDIRGAYEDYKQSVKLDPSMKKKYPWISTGECMSETGNFNDQNWFLKMNFNWMLRYYWDWFTKLFGGSLNGLIWFMIIPYNEEIMDFVEMLEV